MKKTGTGIATFFYPAGLPGGGDPSQAMIKMRNDGSAHLTIGSVDIGQGCKTVLAQIAAEALGIEYEWVTVENDDTDRIPFCMGTFGSRVTYITGNAIIEAAKEVKRILFPMAAQLLEASEEDLIAIVTPCPLRELFRRASRLRSPGDGESVFM